MDEDKIQLPSNRPFIVSIVCIAFFVYSGLNALIFFFSIIFNSWISETLSDYFPEKDIEQINILVISIVAFGLNALSFLGTWYIWNMRKKGFYILSAFSFLFLIFPFLLGYGSWLSLLILSIPLGIFLIYFRRLC